MSTDNPIEDSTASRRREISKTYAVAQTTILCVFTGVFFLDNGHLLLAQGISGTVGGLLCVIGLLFMLAAFVSIGSTIQIAPAPKTGGHLVTKGIYSYFRHPIYTGILMLVVGLVLRKPSILIASAGLVVIVFLLVKVQFEEKLLLLRYNEYADYKKRTWGIIPWFRRLPKETNG